MRIAIIAPGSRGDIQPYVALGKGLGAAGHGVRVVTTQDHAQLVSEHGLELWPIAVDVRQALQDDKTSATLESGKLFASFRKLAQIARRASRLIAEKALEACRDADAVLAGFSGLFIGLAVAEKLGLRLIQAYNVPLTPTSAFPGALLPNLSVWPKGFFHRLSHKFTRQMIWSMSCSSANGARQEVLGLPPAPAFGAFDAEPLRSGPVLYGFSPSVIPKPPDWGENVQITGYWFLDAPAGWSPPAPLVDFLERGPPPVYVGFGSMSNRKPEATTQLVLSALGEAGQRAILLSGWGGLRASGLPDTVHLVDSIPHDWLFPRVAAVVHHGGAGTTAAALRAGVPSIVVPFHGDQPFWAKRVAQLGAGPQPVPRNRLTSRRLARALEAVADPRMRERAAALGVRIRAEAGVARAVEAIEGDPRHPAP